MKTLILILLLPVMSFGQIDTTKFYLSSDTTKKFLISEFTEMPYFYVNNDTAYGNHLIVRNDTTFEIWCDTIEVIKMLWGSGIEYNLEIDRLQKEVERLNGVIDRITGYIIDRLNKVK